MSISEKLTNKLYKWVVLYPRFRKFINRMYSDILKMPQYHINLAPGQVGDYVILVSDPADAEKIAVFFDDAEEMAWHREYRTFTGKLSGEKVSVTSLGIGGPPAAIGVHELAAIGATTFLYSGNCFKPTSPAKSGDLVIPTGCVRDEGTGLQYAPLAFPATADVFVADTLQKTCKKENITHYIGLVRSTDRYYDIAHQESKDFPHILASDLMSAAIFITASVLKKQAGALLMVTKGMQPLEEKQIHATVRTLERLISSK